MVNVSGLEKEHVEENSPQNLHTNWDEDNTQKLVHDPGTNLMPQTHP